MDEECNENELEDRLYAMLHHVDETQINVDTVSENVGKNLLDSAPASTVRRYWKTSGEQNSAYQKVNKPKEHNTSIGTVNELNNNNQKPKEEKCNSTDSSADPLLLFQLPPQSYVKTIEIIDHENEHKVVLESSDEDEVVEVELPPKPTITIVSSDEDDVCIVTEKNNTITKKNKPKKVESRTSHRDREVSASPVPSVVSSVSDEFIRSDCIALNISSKRPDNHSFDFSLHGSDLMEHDTPSKKMKKKKKAKEPLTSTPVVVTPEKPPNNAIDNCFATPKSKSKKKQKNKSYVVSEKCVPNADVYDSDSNQSAIETNTEQRAEKTPPKTDVNKSSQDTNIVPPKEPIVERSKFVTNNKSDALPIKTINLNEKEDIVDITGSDNEATDNSTPTIEENIVMANVRGNSKSDDYEPEAIPPTNPAKYGSTNIPQILNEDLDFDNLNGNGHKSRGYSVQKLRSDMDKFYNESWGGEDFNHWELLKSMPRDADLWEIDPRDKRSLHMAKKKVICNYCNRPGHRDDTCWFKPKTCHMCGTKGHTETRCPNKICVNCGSPNYVFSNVCNNCASWGRITCRECGQRGHPATHCPDLWRRYHNTIDNNVPLAENRYTKKPSEMYCSGCARRGHLVHACRSTLPFSGLYIPAPQVMSYRPVYPPDFNTQHPQHPRVAVRKRHSPAPRPEHPNKKMNVPAPGIAEINEAAKKESRQRKNSQGKRLEDASVNTETPPPAGKNNPAAADNRDNKGRMIQDNEVSDTSAVDTSARIYVTNEVIERLKTEEGEAWLEDVAAERGISVQFERAFLTIKGKVADQEAVHEELREWIKRCGAKKQDKSDGRTEEVAECNEEITHFHYQIPKKKSSAVEHLKCALESLENDLGDPVAMHENLVFLQSRNQVLRKQKVIHRQELFHNRNCINQITKKLNMILLGKAGLADGPEHIMQLHELLEKLTNFKEKKLPKAFRSLIGKHFHPVFSGIARTDYPELLKIYQAPKNNQKNKKKKRKAGNNGAAPNPDSKDANVGSGQKKPRSDPPSKIQNVANIEQMKFCLNRISKSRPTDNALKQTRKVLQVKLKQQINLLHKNRKLTPKVMYKKRWIQKQVQSFLDKVN